ncbi:MAG: hypothetical protein II124_03755 [Clostridia bacterium]|nr:hypothetical protein [Clostridia bacterium]
MSDISDELTPERIKKMGFTDEETAALLNDQNFILAKNQLGHAINFAGFTFSAGLMTGVRPGPNKRVDMRNVALSDIGESLGKGNIVAKSRPVQIESGGLVTAGVIMEIIDGIKADKVVQGDPVALITADQAKNVYNTKEGLKSVGYLVVRELRRL